jgi:hypothetical protein
MRKLLLHLFFSCVPLLCSADEESWSAWARKSLEEMPAEPSYSDLLRLAGISTLRSDHPEVIRVRRLAWARLQAIPNFPERFLVHVRAARQKELTSQHPNFHDYNSARCEVLSAFEKLPHPSVIRAAGELLGDSEWPYPGGVDPGFDGCCFPIPPNSILAARVLGELVSTPPVNASPKNYTAKHVEAWKEWFRKVKAGKLSYRFQGSDKVYNLDGPWPTKGG